MPDDSIEGVTPPVVEPLEGHLHEIIRCQHGMGRRAVNGQQRALQEHDDLFPCMQDLLQQGSDNGIVRNIHVMKQREINPLAVRAAPAVPAVATLPSWSLSPCQSLKSGGRWRRNMRCLLRILHHAVAHPLVFYEVVRLLLLVLVENPNLNGYILNEMLRRAAPAAS